MDFARLEDALAAQVALARALRLKVGALLPGLLDAPVAGGGPGDPERMTGPRLGNRSFPLRTSQIFVLLKRCFAQHAT